MTPVRPHGLVVRGGVAPLIDVGGPEDAADTPFAAAYRFADFAVATLENTGMASLAAPVPIDRRAHRGARLRHALAALPPEATADPDATVAILFADHVLLTDLQPALARHVAIDAHATLLGLPVPVGEVGRRVILDVDGAQQVLDAAETAAPIVAAPGNAGFALAWAGDLIVRGAALPALIEAAGAPDDATFARHLAAILRTVAFNVLDGRLPGSHRTPGAYWHEPLTLEAYYWAQTAFCTQRAPLELGDAAWPVRAMTRAHAAALITGDVAGRGGQAHDVLVADGARIRGGLVLRSLVGRDVVIETGAEVEDAVLLDGCRIGAGARVRRALVCPGAIVPEGAEVGWDAAGIGVRRASGLSVVPSPHVLAPLSPPSPAGILRDS